MCIRDRFNTMKDEENRRRKIFPNTSAWKTAAYIRRLRTKRFISIMPGRQTGQSGMRKMTGRRTKKTLPGSSFSTWPCRQSRYLRVLYGERRAIFKGWWSVWRKTDIAWCWANPEPRNMEAVNFTLQNPLLWSGSMAVSYTHLDVYKRQGSMRIVEIIAVK